MAFEPVDSFPSIFAVFRALQENSLAAWTTDTFHEPYVSRPIPIGRHAHFLADPETIRAVLTDPARFPKAPVQHHFLRPALGRGMITTDGADWKRQRVPVQPGFQGRRLTALVPQMVEAIESHLQRWRAMPPGTAIDLRDEMMRLTLDILCNTLFQRIEFDRAGLGKAITDYLEIFVRPDFLDILLHPPIWVPRARHVRVWPTIRFMRREVRRILAQRRADPDPPEDLLSLLLDAKGKKSEGGLSENEIEDNLLTFLAAGHETTAAALTWTLYLLDFYPWAAERIREEAESVLGGRLPAHDDLAKLNFTRQVFEEAMRLYPPVPMVDRIAAEDAEIGSLRIKKRDPILISTYVLHRHRRLWDDPDRFDPERFSHERSRGRHRYQYLPFIAGPRSCIGAQFAMMEGVAALSTIAREFRFARNPDYQVVPEAFVTLRPRGGLPGRFERW